MQLADQTGVDTVARQIKARPQVQLQVHGDIHGCTDLFLGLAWPQDHDVAVHGGNAAQYIQDEPARVGGQRALRSEEHTSELQSLMRISYAVFCLKKKK